MNYKFLYSILATTALSFSSTLIAQPVIQVDPVIVNKTNPVVTATDRSYVPITSAYSQIPSGIYRSGVIFIADQLERNILVVNKKRATVVTSFTNLDNLSETSSLGRLVGEHLMHELIVRGWSVNDIRMNTELIIGKDGEIAMSRDVKRLRSVIPAENVVTGSYLVTGDGVLLSVRVVEFATGSVLSSSETRLKIDPFIASLIYKPRETPMVKISN
jgi:TolB-like protein